MQRNLKLLLSAAAITITTTFGAAGNAQDIRPNKFIGTTSDGIKIYTRGGRIKLPALGDKFCNVVRNTHTGVNGEILPETDIYALFLGPKAEMNRYWGTDFGLDDLAASNHPDAAAARAKLEKVVKALQDDPDQLRKLHKADDDYIQCEPVSLMNVRNPRFTPG